MENKLEEIYEIVRGFHKFKKKTYYVQTIFILDDGEIFKHKSHHPNLKSAEQSLQSRMIHDKLQGWDKLGVIVGYNILYKNKIIKQIKYKQMPV